MHALTLLFALLAGLWACALLSTLHDLAGATPVPSMPPPSEAPEVAVVVPARNEAHQVAACLASLVAQDWPRLRVICVDDRSEDGTYDAARSVQHERLTVVQGRELAPGWLGKNHANMQGLEHAGEAQWYLFTDADTVHAPGAVSSAMAAAAEGRVDLLTLLPQLTAESFWERSLLPHVLANIVTFFPMRRVNDPRSSLAIGNGQFLLFRREVYEAIGGHAAIRDRVADDLELARLVKRSGRVLRALFGRHLFSVRMYRSFNEIWWGFVKNANAGAGGPLLSAAGAGLTLFTIFPFFALPFLRGTDLWLAAAACALALAQRAVVFRRVFSIPLRYVLLLPFMQALFAVIVLHSAARQVTGKGPLWKGRAYPHGR